MNEWSRLKLTQAGTLERGRSRYRPRYASHLYGGPYPFIQTGQIKAASKYIRSFEQTYSEAGLAQSRLWPKGTLCITIAANIAEIAILDIDACFPDSVLGFRPNTDICDLDFVFYTLKRFQRELQVFGDGSVQDNINLETFEQIDFPFPPLPEQRAIAGVLSSLDDKIDLLHRQNKTLEAMAEALWRKMFVEEADPGWKRGRLGDLGEIVCGKTSPKNTPEYFGGGIPFIKIPDMHGKVFILETEDSLTEAGKQSQANKTIPARSICVSCIATVGLVSMNPVEAQTNQQINTIVPRPEYLRYFVFLLMRNMTDDLLSRASGGTATDNLNTGDFSRIEVLVPPEDVMRRFDRLVKGIFESVHANSKQVLTLSRMRDSLLPKLMSGEVRVKL